MDSFFISYSKFGAGTPKLRFFYSKLRFYGILYEICPAVFGRTFLHPWPQEEYSVNSDTITGIVYIVLGVF
ncbi:MAG: hypothetical protein IJ484_00390, partial [Oscillospiraceae bacterium]|nr:hypothetical protein [Oscillospiraceae bacterium]